MLKLDGPTIRAEFNRQYAGVSHGKWVRLDLPEGPVLARRNIPHHSGQIYVLVVAGVGARKLARHYIVTTKRDLKSNGSTGVSAEVLQTWESLIGLTEQEFGIAPEGAAGVAKYTGIAP